MDEAGNRIAKGVVIPAMSEHVRRELFWVIRNQRASNTPVETGQTFKRLLAEGFDEQEALEMLAAVLLCEMRETVIRGGHDEKRYVGWMNRLRDMSFLDEG